MVEQSKEEFINKVRAEAQQQLKEAEWILQSCKEAELDSSLTVEKLEERITKGAGFR